MSKPLFRPIAPLEVDDSALDALNDRLGVPTMVPAPKSPAASHASTSRSVSPAPQSDTPALSPHEKLTAELPVYLLDALRLEAAKQRVSVRHIVMLALQKAGYAIETRDMVPDARRSAHKTRAQDL